MNKRENDLMLNMVANPTFSLADFGSVGLTAENTSLQSPEYYKNNPFIQKQFTKEDGRFDDKAFNNMYQNAQLGFQIMASDKANQAMQRQLEYAVSNISAPPEKRKSLRDMYKVHTVANPTKQSYGLIGWGEQSQRQFSNDELAQKSKVLLNPTTAGENLENAQWGDDPHNGFFNYWNKTLVMATWDEEGDHIDPLTGMKVHHLKGENKTNQDGEFYYETLDGRDTYGKKVLNKMNVLTEDGSFWNKVDFLDSDDINKSAGGTIMKNLALVGSMFIPYVGPAVTALSLIPQLAGLTGTLGKMATGSDNSFFSELEGFRKSWELQGNVSEEAQQHPWNLENWINLVGDTVSQLKQQRFIFEKIPMLFTGKYAGSRKATAALQKNFEKEASILYKSKLSELEKAAKQSGDITKLQELRMGEKSLATLKGLTEVNAFTKRYNKIGEVLSKGYMTGITVMDSYGEAKEAGASDLEATLLTLGHGAAEAWILNTAIGEWILPELHNERAYNRAAMRKLVQAFKGEEKPVGKKAKEVVQALKADKTNKKEWAQKVINTARDFFKGEYFVNGSKARGIIGTTIAGGLGEGVEEVSEEIIADLSKGIFNTVKWLQGDNDVRMNSFGFTWDDNGNRSWDKDDFWTRYGMSFFGGLIGGGITNVGTSYNVHKELGKMDLNRAKEHLVYALRNGEGDALRKELNSYEVGASDDIAAIPTVDKDGNVITIASGTNSQNYQAKKILNQVIDFVEDTLNASGTNLTDVDFLDKQMLDEWRYQLLSNSQTSLDFIKDFNSLNANLVDLKAKLREQENKLKDLNGDGVTTDAEKRTQINTVNDTITKIKEKIDLTEKRLQGYLNGDYSIEYMSRAFLEMSPFLGMDLDFVPLPIFVEREYGKKFDELSTTEQDEATQKWQAYIQDPQHGDKIKYAAKMLVDMQKLLAPELAGMVIDVDTEDYMKAVSAFRRLIVPELAYAPTDLQVIKNVNESTNYQTMRILQAIDPELVKNTYGNATYLTPKDYAQLFNPTEQELNDYEARYKQAQEDIKQRRVNALQTIQGTLDVHKQALDNAIDKINREKDAEIKKYADIAIKRQEELDKLVARQKELQELRKDPNEYKNKYSATTRSQQTRELNNLPNKIAKAQEKLDTAQADLESNTKLTNVKRESQIAEENKKYYEATKDLVDQHQQESQKFDKQITDELLEQDRIFRNAIATSAYDKIQNYLQAIIDKGYLTTSLRQELNNSLKQLHSHLDQLANNTQFDKAKADDLRTKIETIVGKFKNGKFEGGLPESKLESLLNKFAITTGQNPFNFSQLIDKIYKQISAAKTSSDIKAQEDIEKAMANAQLVLQMARLAVKAATTDTLSIASGNAFGFNAMLNAISEKQGKPLNLALITSDEALPVIDRLQQMSDELAYVKRIYEINKGNKFNQQRYAQRALYKARYTAIANKILRGNTNPLKDWDDWNTLEAALNTVVSENPVTQNPEEFETTKQTLEEALYAFGQKNRHRLENVDSMSEFLDMFDLFDNNTQTMNEKTTRISDVQLAHYIMSCFAMNSSDFYHSVSKLQLGKVAPIPLQIETARMVYAKIMDENLFRVYFKGIEQSIDRKLENMTSEQFKAVMQRNMGDFNLKFVKLENKENWKSGIAYPRYSALSLVEGIAGSGKTFGVFSIINGLINENKELSAKRFFVHGAKQETAQVDEVAKNIFGVGVVKSFTRIDFLKHFVKNFKDLEWKDDHYVVPDNTVEGLETTQEINNSAEVPSIIFIDEISLFSEFDIQLINKWALENGISVIVAGDYHQTNVNADVEFTLKNGETVEYGVNPVPQLFYGPIKLGLSMRTDNSVKTGNQQKFEAFLSSTIDYSEYIKVEFTRQGNQLYGDKVTDDMDNVLEEIRNIIKTLDLANNEKITYIYDTKKSALYTALQSNEFKPYIIEKQGSQAQGDETRYSIVDISDNYNDIDDKKIAAEYLYTGVTRASQGSIIYNPNGDIDIQSKSIDSMYSEAGFQEYLENYTKTELEALRAKYTSGNPIEYKKPNKVDTRKPISPNTNPVQQQNVQQTTQQQQTNTQQKKKTNRNQSQGQGTTSQPNGTSAVPKFNTGDKVKVPSGQVGTVIDFNPTTGHFHVEFPNGGWMTYSESELESYESIDPIDQLVTELNNAGLTITKEQLNQSIGVNDQANMNAIRSEFDGENFEPQDVKGYFYYGVDSIEDLIRLANGDDSGITLTDNLSEPHLFYVTSDNINIAPSVDNIKKIYTDLDSSIISAFRNYFSSINNPLAQSRTFQYMKKLANSIIEEEKKKIEKKPEAKKEEGKELLDDEVLDDAEIDESNNTVIHTNYAPDPENIPEDYLEMCLNSMNFEISFHSFNTLELGAIRDPNNPNKFVFDQKGTYTDKNGNQHSRLDSINGLFKAFNEFRNNNPEFKNLSNKIKNLFTGRQAMSIDPAIRVLGEIQKICKLSPNKSEMLKNLKIILGMSDLFVNFGIKRIPPRSQFNKPNFVDPTENTQLHKDVNEEVYGLDNGVVNEKEVGSIQLVALIGKQKYGEFLEMPLFTLTNPITLINSTTTLPDGTLQPNFPNELAILNSAPTEVYGLMEIYNQNPNSDIGKYCKLYLSGNQFLYRFGKVELDNNGNFINSTKAVKDWVPAHLNQGRLSFAQEKGEYQADTSQLIYKVSDNPMEWQTLQHFMDVDPRVYITESIYQSKDGRLEANGQSCRVNAGHNFILCAESLDVSTDEDAITQYIKEQNDPTLPKTVHLVYVTPPEASVTDYYNFLKQISEKKGSELSYRIGMPNTIHKLLRIIRNHPDLQHLMKNVEFRVSGVQQNMKALNKQLDKLDKAYDTYMQERTEKARQDYIDLFDEPVKGSKSPMLRYFLNKSFLKMFTMTDGEINSDALKLLEKAIEEYNQGQIANGNKPMFLRYAPKLISTSEQYGAFKLMGTTSDGKLIIDSTKKDFFVRGKLDTIEYSGKIPMFQTMMGTAPGLTPEQHSVPRLNHESKKGSQGTWYKEYAIDTTKKPKKARSNNVDYQGVINTLLARTGISYQVRGTTSKEVYQNFVTDINSRTDHNYLAYVIDGKPQIVPISNKYGRSIELLNNKNQPIYYVQNGKSFKLKFKDSQGNVENFNGNVKEGKIEYEAQSKPNRPKQNKTTPKTSTITKESVTQFYNDNIAKFENGRIIFDLTKYPLSVVKYKSGIKDLIRNKHKSQERVEVLKSLDPARINEDQQKWINFMLQVEEQIQQIEDNRKDDSCNITHLT